MIVLFVNNVFVACIVCWIESLEYYLTLRTLHTGPTLGPSCMRIMRLFRMRASKPAFTFPWPTPVKAKPNLALFNRQLKEGDPR